MTEWRKNHFDERAFYAFVKSIGIYPVGSLVRLASGRLAVVVEQTSSLLCPRVKTFFSTRANARIAPELLDLSLRAGSDSIESHESPEKWSFGDLAELWHPLTAASS